MPGKKTEHFSGAMSPNMADAYSKALKLQQMEKGNPVFAQKSKKEQVESMLVKKGAKGSQKPVDEATKKANDQAVSDFMESRGIFAPISAKPKDRDIKSTFGDDPEDGNPLPAPNIAAAADTSDVEAMEMKRAVEQRQREMMQTEANRGLMGKQGAEQSRISRINQFTDMLRQTGKKRPQYAALPPTKRQQKRTARIERRYQKQSQKDPEKALKRYQKRTARAELKTERENARRRARAKPETGGPKEDLMEISGQLSKASKLHGNQSKRVAGVAKGMKGEAGNPYMKRSKSKYGM